MNTSQPFVIAQMRSVLQQISSDYQTQDMPQLLRKAVLAIPQRVLSSEALNEAAVVKSSANAWGYFPIGSLIAAFALLLLALANNAARAEAEWATPLFWISVLMLVAPITARLLWPTVSRRERLALVVVLTVGFYLVKVMNDPAAFTYFDEFLHVRTANDILTTKHLFSSNSGLPISPLYPGLEIVTTAIVNLTGLSVFDAGTLMIGIVRVLFVVALFLFYERISHSARIASLAIVFYMGNSNFIFFDAMFSYESLALPFVAFVLLIESHLENSRGSSLMFILALIIPAAVLIAITHHLTSYFLGFFLLSFAVMLLFKNPHSKSWIVAAVVGGIVVLICALWTSNFVGNATSGYILPIIQDGLQEFWNLITGENTGRKLFESTDGVQNPLLEQLTGMASVGFITLGLPIGFLQAWRRLNNPRALAMGLLTVIYPLSLGLRFTTSGWEIANRSSEFIFIAVGFMLAVGVVGFWQGQSKNRLQLVVLWAVMVTIFMGGLVAGTAPYERLPGPYMVAAGQRSVEPLGIQTAEWTKQYLGEGNRFISDSTNRNLLATYGNQWSITSLSAKFDTSLIFTSSEVGDEEKQAIRDTDMEFVLVDTRLTKALPKLGVYFEVGEYPQEGHKVPLRQQVLEKFNGMANISRVFDSGSIVIYDLRKYDATK